MTQYLITYYDGNCFKVKPILADSIEDAIQKAAPAIEIEDINSIIGTTVVWVHDSYTLQHEVWTDQGVTKL